MKELFGKFFGGLNPAYFFRQLVFGIILGAVFIAGKANSTTGLEFGELLMMVVSTLLYPYSRFVYESIVSFITGGNVFIVNGLVMMFVKVMTMCMCWFMAVFIAPVGLAFLYWRNTRQAAN